MNVESKPASRYGARCATVSSNTSATRKSGRTARTAGTHESWKYDGSTYLAVSMRMPSSAKRWVQPAESADRYAATAGFSCAKSLMPARYGQ